MVERVFVHLYVHECVCVGRCSSFKTSTNTVYNCGTCELVAAQYTPTHTNRCNCNCVRVPFEEPTSCSLYLLTLKHCLQSNESYSINKLFFIILPNNYSCFGQLENEKKNDLWTEIQFRSYNICANGAQWVSPSWCVFWILTPNLHSTNGEFRNKAFDMCQCENYVELKTINIYSLSTMNYCFGFFAKENVVNRLIMMRNM